VSRRASPTLVGGFVLGAAALFVLALAVFGSGRCFRQAIPVALFFQGNVNGLDVGAPVKFRGVEVGRVRKIMLRFEQTPASVDIPVHIELDADKLVSAGIEASFDRRTLDDAVANGLRARLESQSLVTGLLFVQLDFFSDAPGHVGESAAGLPVIPTLPTAFEQAQSAFRQIMAKLDEIDFAGLIDAFRDAADAVRQLAGSSETESTIASINEAVKSVRRLADSLERDVGPLGRSLRATSEQTSATVKELEAAARSARDLLEPDSPFSVRLTQALQELTLAARSLRTLADSLERDPSALVRGRAGGAGNP
jgi:paraquat-inducible protein B